MAVESDISGNLQPDDPRSHDPETAAREHAQLHGLTFEAALEDVRASISRREAAAGRIRKIRDKVRARLAEGYFGQDD